MATNSNSSKESKFYELFVHELKDIYWAEKHLARALPKMTKSATSEKLVKALSDHTEETKNHIERLEKIFELIDEKASGKKCQAMAGLIEEAEEILSDTKKDTVIRDAGIIVACQKVEHYEIASYGSLAEMAKKMGEDECNKLLGETLSEEKKADELLNEIAKQQVNEQAVS